MVRKGRSVVLYQLRLAFLQAIHLENFEDQRCIAENCFRRCAFVAERCPQRNRRNNALRRHRGRTRTCLLMYIRALRLGFRLSVAGVPTVGSESCATPRQTLVTVSLSIDSRFFFSGQASVSALALSPWVSALGRSISMMIELMDFSEYLWEHESVYWLHRQDVHLTFCVLCSYGSPCYTLVVMLGVNTSGNPRNRTCDNGHRHTAQLSLKDKHPWSITSNCRPHEYEEQVTRMLQKSLHDPRCQNRMSVIFHRVSMLAVRVRTRASPPMLSIAILTTTILSLETQFSCIGWRHSTHWSSRTMCDRENLPTSRKRSVAFGRKRGRTMVSQNSDIKWFCCSIFVMLCASMVSIDTDTWICFMWDDKVP